jgi:putative membrane protein
MALTDLPLVNASLNGTATILLLIGYGLIRAKRQRAHQMVMVAALCVSALFLISYLIYHYNVGSVRFTAEGSIRTVYFSILISHTILASAVPFLAIITLVRALRKRFDKHKLIARWTLPIWLYVSVTGVLIYLFLYVWYPAQSGTIVGF